MQSILCFLALVAIAFSQTVPQAGPLNVVSLTNGQTYTGFLPISNQNNGYDVQVFSFYLPENGSSLIVDLVNLNSSANSYIYLFTKTGGLPCSQDEYSYSYYPCALAPYLYTSSSTQNILLPGSSSGLYEFTIGGYYYFSVGRYYASDSDANAPYSLTVTINGTCPTGNVNYFESLSTSNNLMCSGYNTITASPQTFNGSSNAVSYNIYKTTLANNVGNINIVLNSTSTSTYIYGHNYDVPTTSDYNCYTSSSTNDPNNANYYIYQVFCYTPRAGDFWIVLYDSSTNSSFSVTFTTQTCIDALSTGGFNCSYSSTPLNTSATTNLFLTDPATSLTNGFTYFYIDIPANYTGNVLSVSANASSSSSSSYLFYRKDGYPEDSGTYGYQSSSQYSSFSSSPTSFFLTNFEYQVAGRYYFGIECSGSCNVTLTTAILPPSVFTTGIIFTTGTTTASIFTTGSTTGSTTAAVTSGTTTAAINTSGSTTKAVTSGAGNSTLTTKSITTSMMANTTLTTRFVTSMNATTGTGTTGDKESSNVVTLIPSIAFVLLALIAMF